MERKEAIKVVRNIYQTDAEKEALETLIPELRESGDEMTCERAIAILKQQRDFWSYDGPKDKFPPATLRKDLVAALDVALSRLEKQKEPTFISDLPPDDKGEPGENGILEKLKEQKPVMIQWTGRNLKEVIDFTGKSPKFGEWFKSWEDFENYVHSHDDILKLFCEDGSHYEVPIGAWIVKTPDGYNIPSRFRFVQKPAAWSEADKEMLDAMIDLVSNSLYRTLCPREGMLAWLKSLPERFNLQPKQEWSEADEIMLIAISKALGCNTAEKILVKEGVTLMMAAGFLESLRPSWKPSEEQIHAIIEALKYLPNNKDEWRVLDTLADVFRKLM